MRWCVNCVLPDTRPNLSIGPDGVCNACANHLTKPAVDWVERESIFVELVRRTRQRARGGYHCLIPVSGGKDSTWQVVVCRKYGLRPLCVTWRPPRRTPIGEENLRNLISLGVDHIDYTINPDVERRFLVEAIERSGAPAIPMHMAIFNIALTIATRMQIPLVVWGENSAFEYGSSSEASNGFLLDSEWLKRYGVMDGTTVDDWIGETERGRSDRLSWTNAGGVARGRDYRSFSWLLFPVGSGSDLSGRQRTWVQAGGRRKDRRL